MALAIVLAVISGILFADQAMRKRKDKKKIFLAIMALLLSLVLGAIFAVIGV